MIDQFNQLWLTEPANRSDGFEADPVGFEDLMELGGQTMVFFSIALDECFRARFLHSRPQYTWEFPEPVLYQPLPECCGET